MDVKVHTLLDLHTPLVIFATASYTIYCREGAATILDDVESHEYPWLRHAPSEPCRVPNKATSYLFHARLDDSTQSQDRALTVSMSACEQHHYSLSCQYIKSEHSDWLDTLCEVGSGIG